MSEWERRRQRAREREKDTLIKGKVRLCERVGEKEAQKRNFQEEQAEDEGPTPLGCSRAALQL